MPISFNPLKHHMGYIKDFVRNTSFAHNDPDPESVMPVLKHIGNSVADIYTGELSIEEIINQIKKNLDNKDLYIEEQFRKYIGFEPNDYKKIMLSDESVWVMKYLVDNKRYLHVFPGRNESFTYRSRGNSLKTAILFNILYDKGDIILSDLNSVRKYLSLSPLRDLESASGIINDIRMIQSD